MYSTKTNKIIFKINRLSKKRRSTWSVALYLFFLIYIICMYICSILILIILLGHHTSWRTTSEFIDGRSLVRRYFD